MINPNTGALVNAISDTCKNYCPKKNCPTNIKSDIIGIIFECSNFAKVPEGVDDCLGCYNWQEPDGKYVHEEQRKRDNFK